MKNKHLYRCPKCNHFREHNVEVKTPFCDNHTPVSGLERLTYFRYYWVKTTECDFWQPAYLIDTNKFLLVFRKGRVTHVSKRIKEPVNE